MQDCLNLPLSQILFFLERGDEQAIAYVHPSTAVQTPNADELQ
jgi:hypothetical protein